MWSSWNSDPRPSLPFLFIHHLARRRLFTTTTTTQDSVCPRTQCVPGPSSQDSKRPYEESSLRNISPYGISLPTKRHFARPNIYPATYVDQTISCRQTISCDEFSPTPHLDGAKWTPQAATTRLPPGEVLLPHHLTPAIQQILAETLETSAPPTVPNGMRPPHVAVETAAHTSKAAPRV